MRTQIAIFLIVTSIALPAFAQDKACCGSDEIQLQPLEISQESPVGEDPIKTECDLLKPITDDFLLPSLSEVKSYPKGLQRLIAMGNPECDYSDQKNEEGSKKLRYDAIRDGAYTVSIQTAVQWRYQRITELMQSIEYVLNEAFDFRPLLLYNNKLLPPVITKAGSSFKLNNPVEAVSSGTTFRIFQNAKIITSPPSWRDYMWKEFKVIDEVNPVLLPKDKDEEVVWKKAVISGWRQGMQQAHRLFTINLNRLLRDYRGIITYTILEHQGVVSMPMMSEGEFAVKLSTDGKALDVDQKIFRITQNIHFQEMDNWKVKISTAK